jgi:hypothetical protein
MIRATFLGGLLLTTGVHTACMQRNYPYWRACKPAVRQIGAVDARLWVSKSGKQGVGVTVRLLGSESAPVAVRIARAELRVAGGPTVGYDGAPALTLSPGESRYLYLPFSFDNERAWNEGRRCALLRLQIQVGAKHTATWRIQLVHQLRGFHRKRRRDHPVADRLRVARPPAGKPGEWTVAEGSWHHAGLCERGRFAVRCRIAVAVDRKNRRPVKVRVAGARLSLGEAGTLRAEKSGVTLDPDGVLVIRFWPGRRLLRREWPPQARIDYQLEVGGDRLPRQRREVEVLHDKGVDR